MNISLCFRLFMVILLLTLTAFAPAARAQQSAQGNGGVATRSGESEAEKDRLIMELMRRVEALERKLGNAHPASSASPAETPSSPQASSSQGKPPTQPPSGQSMGVASSTRENTPAANAANEPADEPENRALERALVREGGLVLPPNTFEIEPRLAYEHRSRNALQIVDIDGQPQISTQDLKRHDAQAALDFRGGMPWASQWEVSLPYAVNRERRVTAMGPDETNRASGIGSIEIGITKQLMLEDRGRPGLLASLRWRDRGAEEDFTNPVSVSSSFRSLTGALTLIKRQDPMVFFGSLSATKNYSRTIDGALFEPGESTGLTLGSILALSPKTSLRFGMDINYLSELSIDGTKVPGSNTVVGMFNTGYSFILSPKTLLGIEAGIGLTEQAPDFRIGVSLPIRF